MKVPSQKILHDKEPQLHMGLRLQLIIEFCQNLISSRTCLISIWEISKALWIKHNLPGKLLPFKINVPVLRNLPYLDLFLSGSMQWPAHSLTPRKIQIFFYFVEYCCQMHYREYLFILMKTQSNLMYQTWMKLLNQAII